MGSPEARGSRIALETEEVTASQKDKRQTPRAHLPEVQDKVDQSMSLLKSLDIEKAR